MVTRKRDVRETATTSTKDSQDPIGGGGKRTPTAQNAVTDSVEIYLLQDLRYYEISRAVIIRSVGRPKIVCVGAEPAQLRGARFS